MTDIIAKLRLYWRLTKGLQTGLLLATGLAGYMSASCPVTHWRVLLGVAGSLFLAINGSTILNMWCDRDIDCTMRRTQKRPLPAGEILPWEALVLGLLTSVGGVVWALALNPVYASVVSAGLFFDVGIYTIWLKRRTCWSIVWGGISGGMPILAGRAASTGSLDWIGILLSLSILFWIPTHIMTFSIKYSDDYRAARIPTFPSTYGVTATRAAVAICSLMASLIIVFAAYGIGMTWGYLRVLAVLSSGLLALAIRCLIRPSDRLNFGLFKYASIYMLVAMVLLISYGL